ncbi:MAG: hypothetical protein JWQ11_799 [Rhizobacter sp.]|nr:hypothetical protein [Rhizobacter sp.]
MTPIRSTIATLLVLCATSALCACDPRPGTPPTTPTPKTGAILTS